MKRDTCQSIEELLVDFADEALTGAEADRVREHVEQCPHCRATVEALRQSLDVTRTIWEANARDAGRAQTVPARRWRHVAIAASVLLAIGVLTCWLTRRPPVADAPTLAEIENRMAEASRAARLLAAVGQLESHPSLRDVAENQYRYIVERYPDTAAAASARLKLKSLR